MAYRWLSFILVLTGFHLLAEVQFNRDIRPILSDKCWQCHGPDSATREAGLRLDKEEAAKGLHDGKHPIKAGDPSGSLIIERIFSKDADDLMPPPDSNKSLTASEKQLLRTWIKEGAKWEIHWAFQRVEKPEVPSLRKDPWARNEVDHFILQKQKAAGLKPAPEADRETLIRRLSLDLTGLPPTPKEVEAFLADSSPEAYETVVDRLLASSRYGERMAWQWLEAARYADTDGYQNDGPRDMWRWRDWVIEAYNRNMPFDQFTIEQLAGDLLPNPTLDQRIATGFNRNNRYNSEAGLVLEEFLLENAVDRVDTTSTVWMGVTMGCARCHTHKYDPFTQNEYYQLISFFHNITESGRAIKFGNSEPWIPAPTREQQKQLMEHEQELQQAAMELEKARAEALKNLPEFNLADESFGFPIITNGMTHRFDFEKEDKRVKVEKGRPVFREGLFGKAATVGGNGQFNLGKIAAFPTESRFSISFWLKPEKMKEGAILSQEGAGTTRKGMVVELREGHLRFHIITRWIAGVSTLETIEPLRQDEWVHIALTNDGTQRARGMGIYINGIKAETEEILNTNSNTTGKKAPADLRIGGSPHLPHFKGQLDELRLYERTLTPGEIGQLSIRKPVHNLVMKPDKLNKQEKDAVTTWMLEHRTDPRESALVRYNAKLAAFTEFMDSLPTTMVMEESPTKPETFVRIRGEYHNHGEKVTPGVPAIFPPLEKQKDPDRLDFAKWLVSRDHPLTARVTVNRYWQLLFGKGLVKTTEDFGSQGNLPTHPGLLDWLAVDFMEHGWDIKRTLKQLVMSVTYRQSSNLKKALLPKDPENVFYARSPRKKLAGNLLRDQALFVSGLLVEKLGGPSVKPYQPARLWSEASNFRYKQDKGDDLYRRSLYTYWKRTLAPPSMAVLDTADREVCSVKPKRTNTPLQALTLLNETAFVETARKLAERVMKEGEGSPETWIRSAFLWTTSRKPTNQELVVLTSAYERYLAEIKATGKAASGVLKVGDSESDPELETEPLIAMSAVCNVLLNLDETTTRE